MTRPEPMTRESTLARIERHRGPWDFVIVGGGATGAGVAVDAAVARLRGAAAGAERLRQGHVEPQHEAGARRRALPRAGQHLARHGGAEGARHSCARTRRTWSAICRSSSRTTTGGKPRSTALGLKVYNLLAGKYGFGESSHPLARGDAAAAADDQAPTGCAAASSTTTGSSTTRGCSSTWCRRRASTARRC